MEIKQLYNEWKSLKSESINFQRAGIDDNMSESMHKRDTYVFNRIKEIEPIIFAALTERQTLTFNNKIRHEMWQECDLLYYAGWIEVENTIKCDQFSCDTVTGSVTYAKDIYK